MKPTRTDFLATSYHNINFTAPLLSKCRLFLQTLVTNHCCLRPHSCYQHKSNNSSTYTSFQSSSHVPTKQPPHTQTASREYRTTAKMCLFDLLMLAFFVLPYLFVVRNSGSPDLQTCLTTDIMTAWYQRSRQVLPCSPHRGHCPSVIRSTRTITS